jgi:hypothetical protein
MGYKEELRMQIPVGIILTTLTFKCILFYAEKTILSGRDFAVYVGKTRTAS